MTETEKRNTRATLADTLDKLASISEYETPEEAWKLANLIREGKKASVKEWKEEKPFIESFLHRSLLAIANGALTDEFGPILD